MKFILYEIKLWFQDKTAAPRVLKFEPNKVNVITGDASTGKTSIWNIIDYCLLSNRINIANTINEIVDWYGIIFSINDKKFAIARRTPQKNAPSSDICFNEEGLLSNQLNPNISIPELKAKLDVEFGVTDDVRFPFGKKAGSANFNLSYRYFLLFNTLTESIMGSNLTYFDTVLYGKEEYDKILPTIFDMAIGVNDMENLKAKERAVEIKREIANIEKKQKQKDKEQKQYKQSVYNLLNICKEKGFVEYVDNTLSIEDALLKIQGVINNYKELAKNKNLYDELDSLNQQKSKINSQIYSIKKYNTEYSRYKRNIEKVSDSLKPIELLSNQFKDQLIDSYETQSFIKLLEESLLEIKNSSIKTQSLPLKIEVDLNNLKLELKQVEEKILSLEKIKQSYQTELQKYISIGEIKNEFNRINNRKIIEPLDIIRLNKLTDEMRLVEQKPKDNESVKSILKNRLDESIQNIYEKVTSMPTYQNCKTKFDANEMVLQLLPHGEIFPITNVGSKSNYMFMQLCFYLGFHSHMISVGQIHIPRFLFIDQLSIPYYSGNDNSIGNKDKEKLLNAFSILNWFITEINRLYRTDFQILMVEHAPKEYWENNGLTNFVTIEEFVNGKGLVPNEIYQKYNNNE